MKVDETNLSWALFFLNFAVVWREVPVLALLNVAVALFNFYKAISFNPANKGVTPSE